MEGERARLSLGNEGREGKRIERWDSTHDDGGELFVVEPFVSHGRVFQRLSIKLFSKCVRSSSPSHAPFPRTPSLIHLDRRDRSIRNASRSSGARSPSLVALSDVPLPERPMSRSCNQRLGLSETTARAFRNNLCLLSSVPDSRIIHQD